MYTDEQIVELVACSKEIIEPPKKLKEERGYTRQNFSLRSTDGQYNFFGFVRQNINFHENFSIGLDFNPKEEKGTITLLRCNGPHGEHYKYPHHIVPHIHRATADRINQGLKADGDFEITEAYSTLEDAIQFFINEINLKQEDRIKYFPKNSIQESLFEL